MQPLNPPTTNTNTTTLVFTLGSCFMHPCMHFKFFVSNCLEVHLVVSRPVDEPLVEEVLLLLGAQAHGVPSCLEPIRV